MLEHSLVNLFPRIDGAKKSHKQIVFARIYIFETKIQKELTLGTDGLLMSIIKCSLLKY